MTDEPIYDDQGNPVEDPDNDPREWVKKLRKDAKEGKAAQKELEAMRRDLVFKEAGIPDEGPGKLFRKAYDGDVSEDAIKAAAEEYGILNTEPPQAQVQEPTPGSLREPSSLEQLAEQQLAHQRLAQATAGATAPPPESIDEQLTATEKLPLHQQAEAVRQVMVRNQIWADTADAG